MALAMLNPGNLIGEIYKLEAQLGTTTWKAVNQKTGRSVTLEIVEPTTERRVAEFLERMEIVKSIDHPNVAKVLACGRTDGGLGYAAMESVKGGSLDARLSSGVPLSLSDFVLITSHALEGLAALHKANIVHGDIEPGSILLEENVGRPAPKLIGLGRARTAQRTGAEPIPPGDAAALRSLAYASPEQVTGQTTVDEKTDIYSLGVVIFEAIAGRLPIEARDEASLRAAIAAGPDVTLISLRSEVPLPLSRAVQRAIATSPQARHKSARSMHEALLSSLLMASEDVKKCPLPTLAAPVAAPAAEGPAEAKPHEATAEEPAAAVEPPPEPPPEPAPEASPAKAPPEPPAGEAADAATEAKPEPAKAKPEPAKGKPAGSKPGLSKGPPARPEAAKTRPPKPTAKPPAPKAPPAPAKAASPKPAAPAKAAIRDEGTQELTSTELLDVLEPSGNTTKEALAAAVSSEGTQELASTELLDLTDRPSKAGALPPPPPLPPPDKFMVFSAAVAAKIEPGAKGSVSKRTMVGGFGIAPPGAPSDDAKPASDEAPPAPKPADASPAAVPAPPTEPPAEAAPAEASPEPEATEPPVAAEASPAPEPSLPPEPARAAEAEAEDDGKYAEVPARRSGRWALWIALGVGAGAVVALVVAMSSGLVGGSSPPDEGTVAASAAAGLEAPTPSEAGPAAPVDAAAPEAAPPTASGDAAAQADAAPAPDAGPAAADAAPAVVHITLSGVPEGATIRLDGTPVEGTSLELPPDGRERVLAVSADGYRSWRHRFVPREDAALEVEMSPERDATKVANTGSSRRTGESSSRTGRTGGRTTKSKRAGPSLIRDPGF